MNRCFRGFLAFAFALLILLATVGSAEVHANPTPSLLAVARGTDNGVYYNLCFGTCQEVSPGDTTWGSWMKLPGATISAPTLCVYPTANTGGQADLIVRGTSNGIYHMAYSTSLGWGLIPGSWDSPGGGTSDQPACVQYSGYLYLVVRGTDNTLWFNMFNQGTHTWGSWVALSGATISPPQLVFDDYKSNPRLDLFVRGTNNGIYHKAATITNSGAAVTWAASWDNLGGSTPSAPTAAWGGGANVASVYVFVRGNNNAVYYDQLVLLSGTGSSYSPLAWTALGGATLMAMDAAPENPCYGGIGLLVVGTNNAAFGNWFPLTGWLTVNNGNYQAVYASAGGATTIPPTATWISGYDAVLVSGTNGIYYNVFDLNMATAWHGYVSLGGATPSTPAIANLLSAC